MPARLRFLLAALFSIAFFSTVFGASIELAYSSQQKAYRVTRFVDGVPKFDEELPLAEITGSDNVPTGSWWVKGEFSSEIDKAIPIVDYSVKGEARTYQMRSEPTRCLVSFNLDRFFKTVPWLQSKPDALLVFGWQFEGKIVGVFISSPSAGSAFNDDAEFLVSEEHLGGRPYCWVVEGGEISRKPETAPWDALFFRGTEPVDYKELSKARDACERTALHYAAANGLAETARLLLDAKSRLVRAKSEDHLTALSYAVGCGRAEIAKILVDAKAPLEDGWEDLSSIMRRAAEAGHLDVVKALAPDKAKGDDDKWHYSWAASDALNRNYEDIALYLLDNGAGFTVKDEAKGALALGKFANGYPSLGFRLLERFGLPPTYSSDGYGVLHAVASYADIELLEQVGAMGVPINQRTAKGHLPMDFAVGLGNVEAICWFIDNGGGAPSDSESIDPVQYAIKEGQKASVECLIGYGYDVNREVGEGITPLMFAAFRDEIEIAEEIARAGGVWNLGSPHLDYILTRLLSRDAAELVETLIKQGWERERLIGGAFALSEAAVFYEASQTTNLLEQLGWQAPERSLLPVREADQAPELAGEFKISYPEPLQSKYGDMKILVEIALGSDGVPKLVRVLEEGIPRELREIVEPAIYGLRFTPAAKGGAAIPVTMRVRAPLEVDFDPSEAFDMSEVDEPPKALRVSTPFYPSELVRTGAMGLVMVEFILLADGSVLNARAIESTHIAFTRLALRSVNNTTWQPARKDGENVACRVRIPIRFNPN